MKSSPATRLDGFERTLTGNSFLGDVGAAPLARAGLEIGTGSKAKPLEAAAPAHALSLLQRLISEWLHRSSGIKCTQGTPAV